MPRMCSILTDIRLKSFIRAEGDGSAGATGRTEVESHGVAAGSRSIDDLIPRSEGVLSDPRIDDLYRAWSDAFRRQDVDAIVALLTPDYVLWAPGAPPLNADGLRPRLAAAFAVYEIIPTFECEERLVSGDLAFDRGWDTQKLRPRSGGEFQPHRQRVFLLLQRCSDGVWRFARGMSQPGPAA
jgi:ketosteroid isomerase-like protein